MGRAEPSGLAAKIEHDVHIGITRKAALREFTLEAARKARSRTRKNPPATSVTFQPSRGRCPPS
jgi:hypothetical protein